MTHRNKMLLGWAASVAIGLVAGGAAIGAGQTASDGPLSCGIEQSRSGGMVRLESVATSQTSVFGTYAFKVRGSGTDISQGGEFEAAAGETVSLGMVMLGAQGASYDATLEIRANGRSVSCSQRT